VYATRRRANLTIAETAQAAGVSEDDVARAEAEEPVGAPSIDAIEALLKQID
jgi:transcriptional regulator with XRE-family HTH domain